MRHGDIYAKELLEKTEMHTLLQKAGIIDENNKIDISTWSNKQQIYHSDIDELEDLSQDELLCLNDEEILFTVVANDVELLHSADLLDMACDDIVDHDKDEELNLNGSEQSSNSEMHAPLADGPVALSTSLTETHQTTGQNEQVIQEKETRKNTHIYYKGNWYHISQFVSWEQGKFYMPKQSRLNRFYSNYAIFDKFLPPESLLNQDKHLTRGDFIATWNNGIFALEN
ncbi:unnamed protein product [Mytilus edulis]|uniref:Uncharacterized protein n=1 Tax=Mytilus edulis TaxID=6550 RepID=A0A8S3RCL7_MYTED|nr:unnamed protein product [Mytilus edulis]